MRNTITRSFNKIAAACTLYRDKAIIDDTVLIPYLFNTVELAEKYIRKNNLITDGKLVEVVSVAKVSALYGMEESDFIAKAVKVDERSKETRGMISKTIVANEGTLLYMDTQRKVNEMPVIVPKGAKLDKLARSLAPNGCKGITIENIHEVSALYVMSEEDFIANARPMVDHQHYIIK